MRYLLICCAALLAGCACIQEEKKCAETDFLQINKNLKTMPETGPYALGATLHPYRDGYLWKTPKERTSSIMNVATIPVKPMYRYMISWEMLPPQFMKMLLRVTYTDINGNARMPETIGYFENSSSFTQQNKMLFTPPDVKEARFDIIVFNSKLSEKTDRVIGFWKEFKFIELGPQKRKEALKDHYGKNLLPFGNFAELKTGETNLKKFKVTSLGPKPYRLEVVERDGKKVLKANYVPGNYQYIAWATPELPLCGSGGELRCKIRGKGRIQLMIWYNRPTFPTVFKHLGYFDLSPEWKEYRVGFGCDDPLTQKVIFSFACRDNPAEFEVAEMSMFFPDPEK